MSNISLELNFELYQHLVDIYNIPRDDYAADYVFDAGYVNDASPPGMQNGGYQVYANYNNNNPLNENALMSILFSKFYTDKLSNLSNQEYINYILKESYSSYIDYAGEISVFYYEDDMAYIAKDAEKANEKPYINPKIIDFDTSSYASYNIRYYLLYLDIISQLYKFAYERKRNKQTIVIENITIQGRYAIQNGITQLQRCNVFNITLQPVIEGIDNKITDITYTADQNINIAFLTFKADIMKHMKYLYGEDVRLTGLSYLKTIEYFYKFCKLRLMYLVVHSIRLLNDPTRNVVNKFNNFILEEVLAVFTNFRDTINKNVLQGETLKMTKNILYNKSVLDTSTKLQDINDQILANRDHILNNQSLLANIDAEYANTYRVHLTATVILFITVLVTIILISLVQLGNDTKANVSLGITVVLVAFIIVLYVASSFGVAKASVIEKFEERLEIESEIIRFPRATLIAPKTRYTDGTVVNVKSSVTNCVYPLFNYGRTGSRSLQSICASGWSDSGNNKWIAIDLGEYIVPQGFDIIINKDNVTTAPKKVTIYGSKYLSAYTTPFNGNGNLNTNWNTIVTKNLTFTGPVSNGTKTETVDTFEQNPDAYPYYMLVINSVQGSGNTANIKFFHLNGVRNYKVSPEIKDIISSVSAGGGAQAFAAKALPIDYDDTKLISWDLKVTATERSSECVSLSMGTFCFDNSSKIEVENQTSALDPYGAQYVTGIVEATNKSLTDVGYSLVIKYYPTLIDAEQLAKTADFNNMKSVIDAIENQTDTAKAALERTSNVLRSSNIKIDDYISQIADLINTCNAANYMTEYNTSNEMLYGIGGLIATSNRNVQELLKSETNLRGAQERYGISSSLNAELNNKFTELKGNIMTSINYFRNYMDASERSLADSIAVQITIGNVEKIKMKLVTLTDVGKDRVDELTNSIVLREAQARREEAANKAEISAKNSSTSFLNSEAYDLELENKRMEIANTGSDSIINVLGDKVTEEMNRKDAVSSQMGAAKSAKSMAEAAGVAKLDEMNTKYNTNYASLDELNVALNERLNNEKSLKAAALQEYDDMQYEQTVAQHKLNNANIMIAFYDALSAQTNDTINIYDGYVNDFEIKLQDLQREKLALEADLDKKKKESSDNINAALAAYNEMDNRTFQEILLLKVQHSKLLRDIAKRRSDEAEKYQQFLAKRKERDTAQERFDAIVKQKEAELKNRDYYKSVRDAIKDDVDISMVIKDIDVSIVYSITDNINGINYDLITPNMSSEYYEFDKYRKSMQLSAHQSEFDVNDKLLSIRSMEAKTVLFLNLSLIIMICMTLYYYLSSQVAAVIAVVCIIIAIVIYSVKLRGPVRSRARNYYWN